jgi:hypothetical protein
MNEGEIGRVSRARFTKRQSPGPPSVPHSTIVQARRPDRQDVVELTMPHRAALRLLRERVLENTRLALELSRRSCEQYRFARIPDEDRRVFISRLISDQNAMASHSRAQWVGERVDAALETGVVQGMAETTEILYELEELDVFTWRMISSLIDEYYSRIAGVEPEEIRGRIWDEL